MIDAPTDKRVENPTLAELAQCWSNLSHTRRNQQRAYLLERGWRVACRDAVRHHRVHELQRWLKRDGVRDSILQDFSAYDRTDTAGDFWRRQAEAHLHCALAALSQDLAETHEHLRLAEALTGWPQSFYKDLLAYLLDSPKRQCPQSRTVRIKVLLIEPDGDAIVSQLLLERLPNGTGTFYPEPNLGFVLRNRAFQDAENNARMYARLVARVWKDQSDVRWSLEGGVAGKRQLDGASLGGSFAVGLHFLFTRPLDISTVAISASVLRDGSFAAVAGLDSKARSRGLLSNGINTLITSADTPLDISTDLVKIQPVPNAAVAISLIRSLHAKPAKRLIWRAISVCAAIAGVYVGGARVIASHAYSFSFRAGERVFVRTGLPLPLAPHQDIDTGYVLRDFQADTITTLQERGTLWSWSPGAVWADRLVSAMPDSLAKARTMRRLGNLRKSEEAFVPLLLSDQSTVQGPAATEVVQLDPAMRERALNILRPQFDSYVIQRSGGVVETGEAIIELDRSRSHHVASGLRSIIDPRGNSVVNIAVIAVLVRADPSEIPYAKSFLRGLLHDPDTATRARAATTLFEIDHSQADTALPVLTPLLLDPGGNARDPAFAGITEIGVLYPEKMNAALHALSSDHQEGISTALTTMSSGQISQSEAAAISQLLTAQDGASLRSALASVGDFFIPTSDRVPTYSRFLGLRMSMLSHGTASDRGFGEFVDEMRSPLARRWAVYRYACAYAIRYVTPPRRRAYVVQKLRQTWSAESDADVKIALAIAIENLSD